jgi:thiol-disulfide isomerase/thioredoxin
MKGRHIRRGALGAFVFLSSFVGASEALAQQAGIMLGAIAPDATVETLDGRSTRLSAVIGGRPAVLEFWATWCPLCKALEPAMQAARMAHSDIAFVSIGVPQNQTPAAQRAYAEEHGLGGHFVFDRNEEAIKAFAAPHTSYVVVLDATGKVVYTGVGEHQDIEKAIGYLGMGMMDDRMMNDMRGMDTPN